MIGYVNGYDVKEISIKKAQKESFQENLSTSGVPEKSRGEILSILNAKGTVYAWYKKKVIAALYFVERVEGYLPEVPAGEYEDGDGNKVKTNGHKAFAGLRITEAFLSDDAKEICREFHKCILAEVRERVVFSEDEKAIEWNGKLQYPSRVRMGGLSMPLYFIPIVLGLVFGIINNHLGEGLMFGAAFGLIFSLFGFGKKSAWDELDATEENRVKAAQIVRSSVLED